VNRDNALFLLVGLLTGFIFGYLGHEAMAARQPARAPSGAAAAVQAPVEAPAPQAPPAGGGAMPAQIQALVRRVAENPKDADAIRALADANFDIQSWDRAAELYLQYEKLRPGNPDVLTDLGVSYRGQGQPAKALEMFRKAASLKPDHWQAHFNEIIVLAFDLKDYAAADQALARLRQLQPNNPDVPRLAAEIAKQRGAS